MDCIQALAPELSAGDQVDRKVINDLIGITHLGRAWGIHPDGMLQRNRLITYEDTRTLETWLETISYSLMMVLDSDDPETWFSEYGGRP
jgi:hypothetical protein